MDTSKTIPYASLCAGYDGIGLGLKLAGLSLRTVFASEIEAFGAVLLAKKVESGELGEFPVWTNLKTLPFHIFRKALCGGILSAGFPCQPFSAAGQRLATEDPRHLWPYIASGISACRPAYVFLENVPGIISAKCRNQPGAEDGTPVLLYVLRDLEQRGYSCSWDLFSAAECGAPHQRKRVFILGKLNNSKRSRAGESVADSSGGIFYPKHITKKSSLSTSESSPAELANPVRGGIDSRADGTGRETGPEPGGGGEGAGLADDNGSRKPQPKRSIREQRGRVEHSGQELGHPDDSGPQGRIGSELPERASERTPGETGPCGWPGWPARPGEKQHEWEPPRTKNFRSPECGLGGEPHGGASGMDEIIEAIFGPAQRASENIDRLRALGNGVNPDTAELAWRTLYAKLNP